MNPILFDQDLERALVGSILLGGSPRYRQAVSIGMTAKAFGLDQHKRIWALMDLCESSGNVIDLVSIGALCRPHGDVIPESYLIACCESASGIGPSAIETYCRSVMDVATRRNLYISATSIANMAKDPDVSADELRSQVTTLQTLGVGRAPFKRFSDVDDEGGDTGVTTGFGTIDTHVSTNGYPDGQMSVVRAYHKGGKSTFLLSSFMLQLGAGHRALYATFADLNEKNIKRRMKRALSSWSKRPMVLEGPTLEAYERSCSAIDSWEGYVYNAADGDSWDIETFCTWFMYQHNQTPFKCVFVDYAQELTSANKLAQSELSNARCCATELVRLAAKVNIPFVVGAQITEGNEKMGTKTITKGSRVWEEKAGLVLTLNREDSRVELDITYSRFGPSGVKVPMHWDDKHLRIREMS